MIVWREFSKDLRSFYVVVFQYGWYQIKPLNFEVGPLIKLLVHLAAEMVLLTTVLDIPFLRDVIELVIGWSPSNLKDSHDRVKVRQQFRSKKIWSMTIAMPRSKSDFEAPFNDTSIELSDAMVFR